MWVVIKTDALWWQGSLMQRTLVDESFNHRLRYDKFIGIELTPEVPSSIEADHRLRMDICLRISSCGALWWQGDSLLMS